MGLYHPYAASSADAMEGADKVTRLDWPPCLGREDEAIVLPCLAQILPINGLRLEADAEHVGGQRKHRQVSAPGVGLDRADPKLTANAPDLLADADLTAVQVDIGPAQAENFAAPSSTEEQEHKRGG